MNKQLIKDTFLWGFLLWLIGYILGIIFFMILPSWLFGWIIMLIATPITIWVLLKKITGNSFKYYLTISIIWTIIAIILDYFFNVKLFKITNYYKLDVYLYYILTFALPLFIGSKKLKSN